MLKFCVFLSLLLGWFFVVNASPADDTNNNLRQLQQDDELQNCTYFIADLNTFSEDFINYPPQHLCGPEFGPPKCCGYDARNAILKNGGGFQVEYSADYMIEPGQPAASEAAALCYAYVEKLHVTICRHDQGSFLDTSGTFSICQSSCDAVYEACVTTGIIDSSFAGDDGTSFCQNAWVDQCDANPDGYLCEQPIELSVVDAAEGCAVVDTPNEEEVNFMMEHSQNLDTCFAAWAFLGMSFGIWIMVIVLLCVLVCCCICIACVLCCKK